MHCTTDGTALAAALPLATAGLNKPYSVVLTSYNDDRYAIRKQEVVLNWISFLLTGNEDGV